ncbi:MAG: hypothetical protein M1838_006153 [Thelocarpon superellum]|nr:MAG: hypothetical protein M1838_006153 [Thelocarpon superellum]
MPKAPAPRTSTTRAQTGPIPPLRRSSKASSRSARRTASTASPIAVTGPNFLVLVALTSSCDPCITRLLSLPPDLTITQFHEVLQVAFGWQNGHSYQFTLWDASVKRGAGRFERALCDHFSCDVFSLSSSPKPCPDSQRTLLDVFEGEAYGHGKTKLGYLYDMGDGWQHLITCLGRANSYSAKALGSPEDTKMVCLAGEGHPCAEDCGGPVGWEILKASFTGRSHVGDFEVGEEQAEERRDWYTSYCANGDPAGLDPYKWGIKDVNRALRRLSKKWFS